MNAGSSSTHVRFLQFEEWDGPERFGDYLDRIGVSWDAVRLDREHEPLSLDGVRLLVVLGGAMSVHDGDEFPFLHEARTVLRETLDRGLPILGICLGGQLLAQVSGARVVRRAEPEVGVVAIETVPHGGDPVANAIGREAAVLHFHEDEFDVPEGGVLLASSGACRSQIVRCAPRAYAIQFHPEISPATFRTWIEMDYSSTTGDAETARGEALAREAEQREAEIGRTADALFGAMLGIAREVPAT